MAITDEGLRDLYETERGVLARSVSRMVGEEHAEDLVHDAFLAYIDRAPGADRPGAWLSRVVRNRALNELRRARPLPLADEVIPAGGPREDHPGTEAELQAVRDVMSSALTELPERWLEAIRLRYVESLDYPEVARALGIRVEQAYVVVHRAVRRLGTEIVRQLAEAHGAGDCAAALASMAGIEPTAVSGHGATPCVRCRPVWDEIAVLRSAMGLAPIVPLASFRFGFVRRLLAEASARMPAISEPAGRLANGAVAFGLATAALVSPASGARVAPSVPTSVLHRPAVSRAVAPHAAVVPAPARSSNPKATNARTASPSSTNVLPPGPVDIREGQGYRQADVNPTGDGSHTGVVVCEPLEPCSPAGP